MPCSVVADCLNGCLVAETRLRAREDVQIEPQIPARLLYVPAAHDVQEERPEVTPQRLRAIPAIPRTNTLSSLKKAGNLLGPLSCI